MRFCQPHWDMLRKEVADQGLAGWIAPNGTVAAEQLVDQATRRETTPVNYDPLMAAHNMILDRILGMAGLQVFSPEFGCPICRVQERRTPEGACACGEPDCPLTAPNSTPDPEGWLRGPDSAVTAAKQYMAEQGWLTEGGEPS